ncbi:flavodoxin domain-containing protein [Spirochaetota bacterium]
MNSISLVKRNSGMLKKGAFIISLVLIFSIGFSFSAVSVNANDANTKICKIEKVDVNKSKNTEIDKKNVLQAAVPVWGWVLIAIGIVGVLYVLFICSPVIPAFQSKGDPNNFIDHIGENKGKGKKVLLGYVTRHGTSSSIAQKIYDVLIKKGLDVDMRYIPNIGDDEVTSYDSFIIGSSVYWTMATEFQDFVMKHRDTLSKKPVAVFATCMTIQRDTPKNRERVEGYFESGLKKVPEIQPIDKVPFAGNVDMSIINSPERAFLNLLFLITPLKGGDHRDFDKVEKWAEGISSKL